MLSLLLPLLFLPLLGPKPLVLGLPVLALNLLSTRRGPVRLPASLQPSPDTRSFMVAAVYGLGNLAEGGCAVRAPLRWSVAHRASWAGAWLALVAVGAHYAGAIQEPGCAAFLFPEPPANVAAANELTNGTARREGGGKLQACAPPAAAPLYLQLPAGALLALQLRTAQRSDYVNLDYILVDPDAAALPFDANKIGGQTGLSAQRASRLAPGRRKRSLRLYKRQ